MNITPPSENGSQIPKIVRIAKSVRIMNTQTVGRGSTLADSFTVGLTFSETVDIDYNLDSGYRAVSD